MSDAVLNSGGTLQHACITPELLPSDLLKEPCCFYIRFPTGSCGPAAKETLAQKT